MICIKIIQLLLDPKIFKKGIENLSIKGAQKNFIEYVMVIKLMNPIKLSSVPISLNHTENVVKINI